MKDFERRFREKDLFYFNVSQGCDITAKKQV